MVVGTFADGPHTGWLRVHGASSFARGTRRPWHATLVYAIPRDAVVRRVRRSLLLGETVTKARTRWLVRVLLQTGPEGSRQLLGRFCHRRLG